MPQKPQHVIDPRQPFISAGNVSNGTLTLPSNQILTLYATKRGFTGHEMVDGLDIVHMNGRIYDNMIGRFLQADPIVQDPSNTQNFNRYTYVWNNPLAYTDPSGYFSWRQAVGFIGGALQAIPLPMFKNIGRVLIAISAVASYAEAYRTGGLRAAFSQYAFSRLNSLSQTGFRDFGANTNIVAPQATRKYRSPWSGPSSGLEQIFGKNDISGYSLNASDASSNQEYGASETYWDDLVRSADDLFSTGLFPAIDWSLEQGEYATSFWADKQVASGNPLYALPGGLSSLWTRDTAAKTSLTLFGGAAFGNSSSLVAINRFSTTATAGVRASWKNLSFDGPSPGVRYGNGRIFGVRWKQSQWGVRLDYHKLPGDPSPVLHINYGPLGRHEAQLVRLFDPKWFKF